MKNTTAFMVISVLVLSLLPNIASADAIPPMAEVYLDLGSEYASAGNFSIELLRCRNSTFETSYHIDRDAVDLNISIYDPENGCYWKRGSPVAKCRNEVCFVNEGVPYGKDFMLAIYAPAISKVFITNKLRADLGRNEYHIDLSAILPEQVLENATGIQKIIDVEVTESAELSAFTYFVLALAITLILESLVALVYLPTIKLKNKANKILRSILYANIISLPAVWILVVSLPFFSIIAFAEIFAFVFEAYFIHWMNKKYLALKQAFRLSLIMNLVSFFLGGAILVGILVQLA
ncbi:MAG: hypothetical protein ABH829_04950 [archaeon]